MKTTNQTKAIQKAKRLKEEEIARIAWESLSDAEQEAKKIASKLNAITSERADTHSMQYSFYNRNK